MIKKNKQMKPTIGLSKNTNQMVPPKKGLIRISFYVDENSIPMVFQPISINVLPSVTEQHNLMGEFLAFQSQHISTQKKKKSGVEKKNCKKK